MMFWGKVKEMEGADFCCPWHVLLKRKWWFGLGGLVGLILWAGFDLDLLGLMFGLGWERFGLALVNG